MHRASDLHRTRAARLPLTLVIFLWALGCGAGGEGGIPQPSPTTGVSTAPMTAAQPPETFPATTPSTFAFSLNREDGVLAVAAGGQAVFTKKLYPGTATIAFALTPEEMRSVYEALQRADLLAYPTRYTTPPVTTADGGTMSSSMENTDIFSISGAGPAYAISWHYDPGVVDQSTDARSLALREITNRIWKLVTERPEYEAMPPRIGMRA